MNIASLENGDESGSVVKSAPLFSLCGMLNESNEQMLE